MPSAIPIATYRVQLTANFDFDAAAEAARKRLEEHLETLDAAAKRFEEKMLRSATSPIARVR